MFGVVHVTELFQPVESADARLMSTGCVLQLVESADTLLMLLPFSSGLDQGAVSAMYNHCAELFLGRKMYVGLACAGN